VAARLGYRRQTILTQIPFWRARAKQLAGKHRIKETSGPLQASRTHEPYVKNSVMHQPLSVLSKQRRQHLHGYGSRIYHDYLASGRQLHEAQPIGERV
jgi:hypothetical protein